MCFVSSCSQESSRESGSVQKPAARQEPVPEFFGVYLIDGNQLHSLAPGNLESDGPRFTGESRIIIYLADPSIIAAKSGELVLNGKGKIRQDVELFQQTDKIQTVIIHETKNKAVIFEKTLEQIFSQML
jgi:hypothetical protein